MANLFKRLDAGRPQQEPTPSPTPTPLGAGKLLDWLQHDWNQSTISARDIQRHGPRPIRDRVESAIAMAEILVRRGWLVPMKTHRQDRKMWRIAIGPN
jgi:hypothetical protein